MRTWPPLQLLILGLVLAAAGFQLIQLVSVSTPVRTSSGAGDPDATRPERTVFIEWQATTEPVRLLFRSEKEIVLEIRNPDRSGEGIIQLPGEIMALRCEAEWDSSIPLPVALRLQVEPDHRPSRSFNFWLEDAHQLYRMIEL